MIKVKLARGLLKVRTMKNLQPIKDTFLFSFLIFEDTRPSRWVDFLNLRLVVVVEARIKMRSSQSQRAPTMAGVETRAFLKPHTDTWPSYLMDLLSLRLVGTTEAIINVRSLYSLKGFAFILIRTEVLKKKSRHSKALPTTGLHTPWIKSAYSIHE